MKKETAKQYAEKIIKEYGNDRAGELLSEAIEDLAKNNEAISNKNQLKFFVAALFHIK